MIRYGAAVIGALFIAGSVHAQAPTPAGTEIVIGGTGAALGSMALLAAAYRVHHPEVTITLLPSLGSSGGIRALVGNSVDLALSARPLNEAETAQGAIGRPYATTPLVLVTPPNTAVTGLSLTELAAIYTGITTNWPDGSQIRVVLRPASETDTILLRQLSPAMDAAVELALARVGLLTAATDQENADTLERLPGGLGVSTLGQILSENRRLKIIAVDGVVPSAQLVADGAYPFVKTLFAVTTGTVRPAVLDFLAFIASEEGRAILWVTGHVPAE